jgi:UDP-glucose 4-epimerase
VCAHALERGWEVVALDDLSTGREENVPAGAALFRGDIRDPAQVERCFAEFRPTVVAHQAAQASVSVSVRDPVLDADVNVIGSLRVLEACVRHEVERVVFASTGGAIYGEIEPGRRGRVGDPLRPASPYAVSKLAVEHYLHAFRSEHGLASTTLRYANVYGPRQDPHGEAGVVAIFCQRLIASEPVQINAMRAAGDDGCIRDYVYVADVARANLAALAGAVAAPIVDIGTGVETTTAQLLAAIQSQLGTSVAAKRTPRRAGDLERSVLDPAGLQGLNIEPTPLADGLPATVAYFRG